MAAIKYNGETYFFANGKWLTSTSKQVEEGLALKLDQAMKQEKPLEKKVRRPRKVPLEKNNPLTQEQRQAMRILETGENVFLTGEAGTGKSFVLKEYINAHREKNIIICAPTGIAAIHVGGSTLYRVFQVPIAVTRPGDFNRDPDSAIVKADIIIIDEISMCRFDVFEYIVRTIKRAEEIDQNKNKRDYIKEKQIIVVGDFFQLAPVVTSIDKEILENYWDLNIYGSGFAFVSPLWKELHFKSILLQEIIRQKGSEGFIENPNKIRVGDVRGIYWFNENTAREPIENSIHLCATNRRADVINDKKSEELEQEAVVYKATKTGDVKDSDKMTQEVLELKIGMQVMTLVNDTEEGYQNGSIGKVVALNPKSVKVQLDTGKIVKVKMYEWEIIGYEVIEDVVERIVLGTFKQVPLKIAYAITIHKSQGQTYQSANISPDCFAAGQLYVALSRVQKIEKMTLEYSIRPNALKTSQVVKQFYESLRIK